jgi:lysophospholipase L1-like esterase
MTRLTSTIGPARRLALASAVLPLIAVFVFGAAGATATTYPNSLASTGDSITRAYNTGFIPFTDNPSASWSTGTDASVNSHYLRLVSLNPAITGHAYNDARSGARMVDLSGQLATAAGQHVDYVTILMGGNDVCQPTEKQMTPVVDFSNLFATAMTSFTAASPSTLVYVVSIPNVYYLWQSLKDNATARFVWSLFDICQSMLANPLSTVRRDVNRRTRVLKRETDFNASLASICARYAQCRFDGNAAFDTQYTAADISTRDYFHPSGSGQAKLAAISWAAGYWGP